MSDLQSLTLPVLPLSSGVVLPGMVVTLALETDEARAAVDAATDADRAARAPHRRPLRPGRHRRGHRGGRRAASGDAGRRRPRPAPGPHRRRRARPRPCARGRGRAGRRARAHRAGRRARPRVQRRRSRPSSSTAAPWHRRRAERITDPASSPTPPATRPTSASSRRSSCSPRPSTSRRRLELVVGWAKEHARRAGGLTEKIRNDVREGMEKQQREFLLRQQLAAIRKELGEDASRDGQRRLPRPRRGRRPAREGPRGRAAARSTSWSARSEQSPEARLDPHLARHRPRAAVERAHRRHRRPRRRPRGARRRPRRPRRRQGPHRRVPRRAQARAPTAGLDDGRRPRLRRGARAGRPARRRQDLARRVRRAGAGPQVRPRRARRRPRRGRDPRPPAHLRRRAARPHRPGDPRGRLDEPGRAARRGRQGRRRLPRRPGRGPARGARPGAEPHLPRPLPRGRPRPVRRAVPRHRQRGRHHPRPAAGPDGARHASTATPRTRRSPSPATTCCPGSSSGPACDADEVDVTDDALRHDRRRVHPRGGRAAARAATSAKVLRKVAVDAATGDATAPVARRRRRRCATSSGRPRFTPESARAHGGARAWPPAWRSPARAATCSSSRPPADGPASRA